MLYFDNLPWSAAVLHLWLSPFFKRSRIFVNMTLENQQEHLQIALPLFAPMYEQLSHFHVPIEFSPHLHFLLLDMINIWISVLSACPLHAFEADFDGELRTTVPPFLLTLRVIWPMDPAPTNSKLCTHHSRLGPYVPFAV